MSRIDDLLREAISRRRAVGVTAAAATTDGVLYQGAFGRMNGDPSSELGMDGVFRIASMTKAITSVAALQLVERGELDLDADVGEVLPALRDPQVLEGFDAESGEPILRPAAAPITPRQLLTHTSGLAYDIWSPELVEYTKRTGLPSVLDGVAGFLEVPLIHDPGTRWCYGISTDRLGQIVERVSGLRLDAYLRQHVSGPLGMPETDFVVTQSQLSRVPAVYARLEDGRLTLSPESSAAPTEVSFCEGGGGLVSTTLEYLRFLRTILGGGELDGTRILARETVERMSQNQIGELEQEILRTAMPPISNDVEFLPGMVKKWGFGFMINTEPIEGRRAAGSLAWAGLFNSYFWIDSASGVCGVLLTQILPFFDREVVSLFEDFERAVYDSL
jgi:CubicO group peptidase (beta-lactamase class C family)